MEKIKRIIKTKGKDGEIYYKCLKCGSVGNWEEFILKSFCCKK